MKFNYLARNLEGETQAGTVEASSQQAALKTLQDHNLVVVRLQPVEKVALFSKKIKFFDRVKRKEAFVFFRQLAILVDADVPLVQSLRALGQQVDNPYFKEIILGLADDVDGGMALSKALSKRPKVFSAFHVNLINSGEVAGRLQECLTYLAEYLEKEYYLISRVRGAMIYPLFILGVFLIVGILILIMVIPQLTSILIESGQELPFATKMVIWTSDFIRNWGWLVGLFSMISGLSFWRYTKTEQGKFFWHRLKLKLPIFGKILQKTYLARLADNLSALVRGGVAIIQSLNITGRVVGNLVFQEILFKARDEVKGGKTIGLVLEQYKEFPPLFCQMIKTGEKTGKLDDILTKLSGFYNKEVENVVDNLAQLIEPVLLVFLGFGITVLIFAVFMPIYNLAGVL